MSRTEDANYTQGLIKKQTARWKKILNVQAPYGWNLRRLEPGYTLELGCGIGRNLLHLRGHAVGIDHNVASVRYANQRNLVAFTPQEFEHSSINRQAAFDSLLAAHVLEHMHKEAGISLIRAYLPNLKPLGRLILITPQEAGFRSDASHVEFTTFAALGEICDQLGFDVCRQYSFPFPRLAGLIFPYNEFVVVGQRRRTAPGTGATPDST